MRVLVILEAGNAFPSGYIRGLIYRDAFADRGVEAHYVSRLPARLMRLANAFAHLLAPALAGASPSAQQGLLNALARWREDAIVRRARGYDVVYMSKVRSARLVSRLRARTRARLVMDFGDAIWLPRYGIAQVDRMLGTVDAVTTDNEMTAAYIRRFNPNCTVIPDCPQVEAFDARRAERDALPDDPVVLGWVGSATTAYNLYAVWEALERLAARRDNVRLRLLGVHPGHPAVPRFERVPVSALPQYTQERMVGDVLRMHVGLFPLQDVEASRVRGVLKATVYMSGGATVVASPVGQTPDLIRDGENGFLAASPAEWEDRLDRLVADAPLRRRLAQAGLASVRAGFTVARSFEKLCGVLFPGEGRTS